MRDLVVCNKTINHACFFLLGKNNIEVLIFVIYLWRESERNCLFFFFFNLWLFSK